MRRLDVLRFARRALGANKLRSALTSLGIIIGVASVVVMVAIGAGTEARIREEIQRLGTNVIVVTPGSASTGRVRLGAGTRASLTDADAAAIRDEVSGITTAAASIGGVVHLTTAIDNWSTGVLGITEEYFTARNWQLAAGRAIDDIDVAKSAKVAMLGVTTAEKLFGDANLIGQIVRGNQLPLEVIGLLQPKGNTLDGSDLDDIVMLPLTAAREQLIGRNMAKVGSVHMITVKVTDGSAINAAIEEVRDVLRARHQLAPDQPDDFRINNLAETMKVQEASSAAMTQLLAAIASISLLVGGIGIMNIMLVSVTERTREIGVRMAVGAKPANIRSQFLSEAVLLCLAGGAAGAIIGLAGARFIELYFDVRVAITPEPVIIAFAFSAIVGIVFGLYPAIRASHLSPVEALRFE